MKTVIVKPERCVSCLQCRFACAVTHSKTKHPYTSISETPLSKPRIHIALFSNNQPFPNKCRHCNPAPCESACITRAIYRDNEKDIVLIDPSRCINCGMCAMACPFGVIRYHLQIINRIAAHKCDQCILRQSEGKIPACVETCKVGALVFEEINKNMDTETAKIAKLVWLGIREKSEEDNALNILKQYKTTLNEIAKRR